MQKKVVIFLYHDFFNVKGVSMLFCEVSIYYGHLLSVYTALLRSFIKNFIKREILLLFSLLWINVSLRIEPRNLKIQAKAIGKYPIALSLS